MVVCHCHFSIQNSILCKDGPGHLQMWPRSVFRKCSVVIAKLGWSIFFCVCQCFRSCLRLFSCTVHDMSIAVVYYILLLFPKSFAAIIQILSKYSSQLVCSRSVSCYYISGSVFHVIATVSHVVSALSLLQFYEYVCLYLWLSCLYFTRLVLIFLSRAR